MAIHECCECKYMKSLEDEYSRMYYICMFSQSPCFLQETGVCGNCELDDTQEEWYQDFE